MPTITKKPRRWQQGKEKKAFDRRKDDGPKFDYNKPEWRKDRAAHISQNPICVKCLEMEPQRYTTATVSDHITPIRQGGEMWDWSNRQALCQTCHNQKSGREAHGHFKKDE